MVNIKAEDDLDKVIFNIRWDYLASSKDTLDATCFCYDDFGKKLERINYSNVRSSDGAIKHSGDTDNKTTGDHKIEVNVKKLKQDCSKVFFTISAFILPSIGKYKSVSISLIDERRPTAQLAPAFILNSNINAKSVLLCYLSRTHNGWEVIESGCSLLGNATNYNPIEEYLSTL